MRITPCCKSKEWIFPFRHDIHNSNFDCIIVKCKICGNEFPTENLIEVKKGLNPVTYYCDNCHKSLEEEHKNEVIKLQEENAEIQNLKIENTQLRKIKDELEEENAELKNVVVMLSNKYRKSK